MPQRTTSPTAPAGQQPAEWYAIRRLPARTQASGQTDGAPPQAAAEILIYGDIGESWWNESVSAATFVKELAALDVSDITVRIASIGGSVPDGIAIHNAIKRHPARVTTVVDSMAMSIASLIAIAGDQVQMAENAVLMIHAPWTWADGNAAQLRELADMLDTWARAMATSYAAKTGQPVDDVLPLLTDGADHYYTAAEAQAAGLVDAVVPAVPVAAMARPASARAARLPAAIAARLGLSASPASAADQSTPVAQPTTSLEPVAMPTPTNAPAAQPTAADIEAARAAGARAEAERRTAIEASSAPFADRAGMPAVVAACIADPAVSAIEADRRILAHLAKGVTSVGRVVTVDDERDKTRAAMTNAILARGGALGEGGRAIAMDSANPYRGRTLLEVAEACVRASGRNTGGMDKFEIVHAAFVGQGTSDFPVLLENIVHKSLLGAYRAAPDKWRMIASVGSVGDLRDHNRYRTGSVGNLDDLDEHGEYKNKQIPDGEKAKVKVGKKGNIIAITDELVINDDLGALVGLSTMLGRAAARTIESSVWAYLASNPAIDDGIALFHASHGNLAGTGAAPSTATLEAARLALAAQKDISGNDFLDIVPGIAVCPMALGSTIRLTIGAEYDPETNNKLQRPNIVRNMVSQVVDTPRLTGTGWAIFADPQANPVLEVSFLDGVQEPRITTMDGWRIDGAEMKVTLRWGVKAIDYRGAYWNPGA